MAGADDDFRQKLLATFRDEAGEHLQSISTGLIELENAPDTVRFAAVVESVFREAHSLKGAARAVNFKAIEAACQSLESVFAALKDKRLAVSTPLFDLLQEAIDALGKAVSDETPLADSAAEIGALTRRLDDALRGQALQTAPVRPEPAQQAAPPVAPPADVPQAKSEAPAKPQPGADPGGTVRASTHKLDTVMRQVEELLVPRLASAQRIGELHEIAVSFAGPKQQWTHIRPALRMVERYIEKNSGSAAQPHLRTAELARLLEHVEGDHQFIKTLEQQLLRLSDQAARNLRVLVGITDNLLYEVKQLQQLPFASLLETFPRIARELAHDQGKQAELTFHGGEIEIDRRILEEMKAPLLHLLRNCMDHGIEFPSVREAKGKPPHATIGIDIAQYDSGRIRIRVADDGAGMDAAGLKSAALELGLLSAGEAEKLSEQEALALAFRSGISTSQAVSDISGRGLGLAIVREKVERLGGDVTLESRSDVGTVFLITLPLMMATLRGVLVRSGEHRFVIPAFGIERVLRVARQDIRTVQNRATVVLDGQTVALVSLGDVLELPPRVAETDAPEQVQMAVLGAGGQRVAFMVDEVVGEQEVLVKALGRQLVRVRNVIGACVLGTGRVVAVLNVPDLLKSAARHGAALPVVAAKRSVPARRSILLAEDSITSRALLKNILESAAFLVTTAVDGLDAYSQLKNGKFDLVVSDVEMPRMDGFELTARMRADKQLAAMPVVLVTALDSREHRERGLDAGANAYIVKSSFDQSNLLEAVHRLI